MAKSQNQTGINCSSIQHVGLHIIRCSDFKHYHKSKVVDITRLLFEIHGKVSFIEGIDSDSNNIFLWHESKDVNKKSLFPKFELIPILRFQVMHDCVDYCVE